MLFSSSAIEAFPSEVQQQLQLLKEKDAQITGIPAHYFPSLPDVSDF